VTAMPPPMGVTGKQNHDRPSTVASK